MCPRSPDRASPLGRAVPKTLKPFPESWSPAVPAPHTSRGPFMEHLCRCGRAAGPPLSDSDGPVAPAAGACPQPPFWNCTHFILLLCVQSWFPNDSVGSPHAIVSCPAVLFPITHEDSAVMESSHRARCAASRAWVSPGLLDVWPHVSEQLSVAGVSFSGVGCGCQPGCWMHRFCSLDSHERPPGPLQGWCWM